MLFNSLEFYVFFPIVVAVYFLLPHRFRWMWLLAASCYFYMSFIPGYIFILGATILASYAVGLHIEASQGSKRKLFLLLGIIANVGFLAFFKYYGFAAANLNALADFLGWNYELSILAIILPLGLSFHTFQALSYIIEVYRGKQKAEHHLGIFSVYVLFFPQLVAGPIERPQNLLHQFYEYHPFDAARVISGLQLMARGFFKKIVIADNAALAVNTIYMNVELYHGIPLLIGVMFFGIQVFCDFSGYSDIARGTAQVMGFNLMLNFNNPYFSQSLAEFWRKWHISLSTWFRDYLFQPLSYARNTLSLSWLYISLVVTFLVSGLWHGANWTYVLWGFLHGFFMVLSLATSRLRAAIVSLLRLDRSPFILKWLRIGTTVTIVFLLFILFRAATIQDAWYVYTHLFSGIWGQMHPSVLRAQSPGIYFGGLITVALSILFYMLFFYGIRSLRYSFVRWGLWYGFMLWLLYFGAFSHQSFIYFQF